MLGFMSFTLLTVAVQGKPPLEVSASGGTLDLATRGVEAECCKRMVYQVKGCVNHGMTLLDGQGTQLVEFLMGGWYNTRSRLIVTPTGGRSEPSTPQLLHCDEFRWFWMSWDAGRIKYGKGRVPGQNAVFNLLDQTGNLVKKLGLKKINGAASTIRVGEGEERGRFARVLEEGKFSDGLISETSTSRGRCASLCSKHVNCGLFSYNSDLGLCAIFDRMTSAFTVTSEIGWTSWKLLYCYP